MDDDLFSIVLLLNFNCRRRCLLLFFFFFFITSRSMAPYQVQVKKPVQVPTIIIIITVLLPSAADRRTIIFVILLVLLSRNNASIPSLSITCSVKRLALW